jgi:Na+/melibiose symporter-like transporter
VTDPNPAPIGIVIIVVGIFLLLSILYSFIICHKWGKVDFALLATVVLAFITELIFFFVVIENQQILPDMAIVRKFLDVFNQ